MYHENLALWKNGGIEDVNERVRFIADMNKFS